MAEPNATSTPETAVIQVTSLLGALMLRRTCFDQYQQSVLLAQGAAQDTILVDAKRLAHALKGMSGWATITINDEQLVISATGRTVRIRTADLVFPKWPPFESTGPKAVLGASELAWALTSVGTDDTLPQLTAVSFDDGAMVTTDRFRLTRIKYAESGFTAPVPSAALRAFAKNEGIVYVEPGKCSEEVDGWGSNPWVELTAGVRTVITVTGEGQFPQWKRLIPVDAPVRLMLHRGDLLKAVDGDEITITLMPTGKNKTTMTVRSVSDGMETEQEVKLIQTNRYEPEEPFTVTLRSKYVKDCMRGVGSGMVLFDASAPDKPVVFQDVAEKQLHIIMPVRPSRQAKAS